MRPQPRYKPGDLIGGKYQVGLPARMGGMGEVYLCLDTETNYPYALKTFQQKYVTATGLRQAFEEEVAYWVALEIHPNIVRCHLMEILDYQPIMVLEWINGEAGRGSDLRGWLRHGSLDLETALNFAIDITRGMDWVQQKSPGLTHRDLKPGNILVEQGGRAKITDFGLAAISSRVGLEIAMGEGLAGRHSLQASGGIAGTPPYMAPEQWEGLDPDPRDDIYALGCILHELLSGEQAFGLTDHPRNHTETILAYRELHQAGEIPTLSETIPVPIRKLTQRCLAKRRADRFPSMEALMKALCQVYTEILNKPSRETPPPGEFTTVDYNNRGVTYGSLNRHEQAIADFNRALELDAQNVLAYNNRGIAYDNLNHHEQAIADFNRALELDAQNVLAYNNRGNSNTLLGHLQRAIEDYDRAIVLDPTFAKPYLNRGANYVRLGQPQRAIEDFDRAIELDPQYAEAYYNRGIIYADLGQYQRSIEDYDRAIELDPHYMVAYTNRGNSYAWLGQHQHALEDYEHALQLNPQDSINYYNKAVALVKTNQLNAAMIAARRAHQLGHPDAIEVISLIPQLVTVPQEVSTAFEAFMKVSSLKEMQRVVLQHPMLLEPDFIQEIELVIATQISQRDKPSFAQRLAWLKQIAGGG